MEAINFFKFNKRFKNSYYSFIPYCCLIDDPVGIKWQKILMYYISNDTYSEKINDIKLILFEREIVVIVDDKNCIIIINIEEFKLFLEKKKKMQQQKLSNECKSCQLLSKKKQIECKYCRSKKQYIIWNCYRNLFKIIPNIKNNINIVKINFIDIRTNQSSKCNKLIILTENKEIYSAKIRKSYCNNGLKLLYKNIDNYQLFSDNILFRQIKNNKELYSFIDFNNLGKNKVIHELSSQKYSIDIPSNINIITHIFQKRMDYVYSVGAISDNLMCYSLTFCIKSDYSKSAVRSGLEAVTTKSVMRNGLAAMTTTTTMTMTTQTKMKIVKNGIIFRYSTDPTDYALTCLIENNWLNYVDCGSDAQYREIMDDCYCMILYQHYIIFLLLSRHAILIYDKVFQVFGLGVLSMFHGNQLKLNEIINWRQSHLQLHDIRINEKLKNVVIRLISYIKTKTRCFIPTLCWEIIFNYIKEYESLNILISTPKKKRVLVNIMKLTNKKQKIK